MAKYILPEKKEEKEDAVETMGVPDVYARTLYIPVNKEIIGDNAILFPSYDSKNR